MARQARLALWLMRDARDGALLLQRLVDWLGQLEELARAPGGERALAPLLHYVATVSLDLQLEQFRAILRERAPAAESITMTIAEQLRAEGEARGEARRGPRGAPRPSGVAARDPASAWVSGDGRGAWSRRSMLRRRCSRALDKSCRSGREPRRRVRGSLTCDGACLRTACVPYGHRNDYRIFAAVVEQGALRDEIGLQDEAPKRRVFRSGRWYRPRRP